MLAYGARTYTALTSTTDDFTPEQQFIMAFGQEYCGTTGPERKRVLMLIDPHSSFCAHPIAKPAQQKLSGSWIRRKRAVWSVGTLR